MISRERAIETLAGEQFDVAVIGGGITRAGVARALANEHHWDQQRVQAELAGFAAEAQAEGIAA